MREIKFRAWDRVQKKMFQNVSTGTVTVWGEGRDAAESKDCDFMQYTGLKDKNGKEIYEGDILKTRNNIIELVEWDRSQSGDGNGIEAVGWIDYESTYSKAVEIIGNIYENPELL